MTVKELIEELEKVNPDAQVGISIGYDYDSIVSTEDFTIEADGNFVDIYGTDNYETEEAKKIELKIEPARHDSTPMDALRERMKQKVG